MILSARRMVWRGQSYAVESKRSIDLKTQFVAQMSIRYSILLRPSFINKWFHRGLDVSSSWGESSESTPYLPMILYSRRMVRRGQSYAVDSKHSIDLKTQFVTHVSIRYSVLPRPRFINKWFHYGLEVSSSWGESRNPLPIDQWFCMLEGWSEEDRAMLLIQSVQLTWKLNLSPTCWSGNLFCRGLLLSTNDFVVVWMFLWVGERAGIYSVLTNDFVC